MSGLKLPPTSDFEKKLAVMLAMELPVARRNHDAGAALMETLINNLALTIAVLTAGDEKLMSEILEGASAMLFEAAAQKATTGKLIGGKLG